MSAYTFGDSSLLDFADAIREVLGLEPLPCRHHLECKRTEEERFYAEPFDDPDSHLDHTGRVRRTPTCP